MMRKFLPAVSIFLLLLNAAPVSGRKGIEPADYARINATLVETHVLPRYALLLAATEAFAATAKDFCANDDRASRAHMRARFHDAMEAWMGVQHLRFGPVELFLRADRFYFWPQARGKTAPAVRALVAAGDESALLPPRIDRASTAVQGLLAAEVLLYSAEFLGAGRGTSMIGCRLLKAVTLNMRGMAAGILAGWREGEPPFAQFLAEPGPQNPYFQDHRDATLSFFKSLHDSLQLIADVKLRPVVGNTIQAARPRLAESRLSGRSHRNIIDNLEALQALYRGEGGPGLGDLVKTADPKLDRLLRKAFRLTIATARSIDRPLEEAAVDLPFWSRTEKLTIQVRALRQIVKDRLAPALALSAGFNALDGD